MKTVMACALALGIAGVTAEARAEGLDCCKSPAAAACCSNNKMTGKICLEASEVTAAELAKRLSLALGAEVRVNGPSFGTFSVQLCAASPEEAVREVATVLHARYRRAIIFGDGPAAPSCLDRPLTVAFQNSIASTAAFVTAAQAGGYGVVADRPLKGRVTFSGKAVAAGTVLDAIAQASGVTWKVGYVLQIGPETVTTRRGDTSKGVGSGSTLMARPGSPHTHLHRGRGGVETVAPAPGQLVKDAEAQMQRLVEEAFRRQQLGEWATIFTQEGPKETKRAIRDLRIRVETTIQKLESYPPQNRHLGIAMWRARYERMLNDYKGLTPDQQKMVQPVMEAMKYFAAPADN